MPRIRQWWAAALIALVLALPTTAALAADQAPASPHHPQYIECQYTNETDNIQVNNGSNPFWDDLGNQWVVYYDITRDIHDNAPCSMRVDIRIFNPAPDGSWHGTVNIYAYVNGAYNSYSYLQFNGSSTYQYHLVVRGPWFGADFGSYVLYTNEFNGNSTYSRASTNFSV